VRQYYRRQDVLQLVPGFFFQWRAAVLSIILPHDYVCRQDVLELVPGLRTPPLYLIMIFFIMCVLLLVTRARARSRSQNAARKWKTWMGPASGAAAEARALAMSWLAQLLISPNYTDLL
jgi:hypothetical protein